MSHHPLPFLPLCLSLCLLLNESLVALVVADSDPLTDFNPDAKSFTLHNIFSNGDVSVGPGGTRAALSTSIFPALASQGITIVRFEMLPCGINTPHTHPRATEILTLIQGGPLQAGFIDTHGMAHVDILYAGDVTIFPRGLLHFELNVGTDTAHYLSALNSENPGTLTAVDSLFKVPRRALATAFNQTQRNILGIQANLFPIDGRQRLEKSDLSGCIPGKDIVTNF